ncbi:MAG TPA: nucleotidyltransferase family protein [Terriglobales bacterium]|nr:nucleotidyltransferase family protein [Terriglobales bacterium]
MSSLASSPAQAEHPSAAITPTFVREFAFLVACCAVERTRASAANFQTLVENDFDWPRLFRLAEHHGVTPLIYQALQNCTLPAPPAMLDELRNRYERNTRKNLQFTAELFRILDCLDKNSIPTIPMKGPVLAETVYRDLALRDFSDLDVLVRRKDVLKAKAALGVLGYAANTQLSEAEERAYLATGYEYTFDGPAGRNLLEIQWDILPRFYAVDFDCDAFFERSQTVTLCGRAVRSLSVEDLLLTLCVHAAKHAWVRLHWLRDIAGALESHPHPIDWADFQRRARELGISRMVGVSLMLAHRLLDANVPESVKTAWNADLEIKGVVDEILRGLPMAEEYNAESLRYFRLMMRLRERRSDRLRLLYRLALTPGPGEWAVVRLPKPLFPLYHVIRMFRLGARALRQNRD